MHKKEKSNNRIEKVIPLCRVLRIKKSHQNNVGQSSGDNQGDDYLNYNKLLLILIALCQKALADADRGCTKVGIWTGERVHGILL